MAHFHRTRSNLLNILRSLIFLEITPIARHTLKERSQSHITLRFTEKLSILLAGVTIENPVHIFQRRALSFRKEEPNPDDATGKETSEEDISTPFPILEHRGNKEGNSEVIDPVTEGADGRTLCANGEREDLGNEGP